MDLIYRQTVLDALAEINKEVEDGDGFQYEKWREYFAEMTSPAQLQSAGDIISRHAAIDAVERAKTAMSTDGEIYCAKINAQMNIQLLPSAQPEQTDCEYCHEDSDGYVRPIEKNSHAWLVRRGRTMKLRVGFKGEYRECDILFCPMCGRRLPTYG